MREMNYPLAYAPEEHVREIGRSAPADHDQTGSDFVRPLREHLRGHALEDRRRHRGGSSRIGRPALKLSRQHVLLFQDPRLELAKDGTRSRQVVRVPDVEEFHAGAGARGDRDRNVEGAARRR